MLEKLYNITTAHFSRRKALVARRHTLNSNLALQRLEAKLKLNWPTQIVFVQNKTWDNCLTHWVGQ